KRLEYWRMHSARRLKYLDGRDQSSRRHSIHLRDELGVEVVIRVLPSPTALWYPVTTPDGLGRLPLGPLPNVVNVGWNERDLSSVLENKRNGRCVTRWSLGGISVAFPDGPEHVIERLV